MADRNFWDRMMQGFDLDAEPLPGQPLLELVGTQRILIENHCGLAEYGDKLMRVKVRKGSICICGKELGLVQMSRERLIICGCIESVHLIRGK